MTADQSEKVKDSLRGKKSFFLYIFKPQIALFLAIPVLYPSLFLQLGTAVPFGNHADLNYIWGVLAHLLKTDFGLLYQLPVFQPLPDMLTSCHTLFGLYPFFKFFQILGFDLTASHGLYLISALYLGALGSQLMLRELAVPRWIAFSIAFFYLAWGINPIHFIWLNYLSFFWAPFIMLFLIRWFKSPGWLNGFSAALCLGMLFAANEYYGVHFIVFLLPPVICALLIQKWKQKKTWLSLLLPLLLVGLLLAALYAPLIKTGLHISAQPDFNAKDFNLAELISADDLFCYSHPLATLFPKASFSGQPLYLGVGFAVFLLSFFAAPFARARIIWPTLILAYAAAAFLYFISPLGLLFWVLGLLLAMSALFLGGHREYDSWGRMAAWISGAFLLVIWGMPQVDPNGYLSVYRLVWSHVPGFAGFRLFSRVFPLLLPFLMIMAARGMQLMSERRISKRAVFIVSTIALVLMIGENHYLKNQFKHLEAPYLRPEAYQAVPDNERGTLLALPLFHKFISLDENARYMANQHYHNLTLLAGRTSYLPLPYFLTLRGIVDHGRLNEKSLSQLIEGHALSHLVVHWDWLRELYLGPESGIPGEIRASLHQLEDWLKLVYQDESTSVYEVVDPRKKLFFRRTLSLGQLSGNAVQVKVLSGTGKRLSFWVDGQLIPRTTPVFPDDLVKLSPGWLPKTGPVHLNIRMDEPAVLDIRIVKR